MVRIGIAGIGFMGVTHFKAVQAIRGARVTALFTRDPKKRAGDWTAVKGNFGEGGGRQDLSKVKRYDDLDAMFADPDLDLIDICLPTYLHRDAAIRALGAGKHVLVEKPIALNVRDADRMLAAAARARRLLMVGQVLRFFPEFAVLKAAMDSGKHGKLMGAHFRRIISKPNWSRDDWFSDLSLTGGAGLDLHIHDTDFVLHLLGKPDRVFASGTVLQGFVQYLTTHYLYGGGNVSVTAESGCVSQSGLPFRHGYEVYFEKTSFLYDSLSGGSVLQLTADGKKTTPRFPSQDAFVSEIRHAVDCVREGRPSAVISGESARESLRLCLLESESVKKGKILSV
jgi:predicted dehydrogenase